MLIGINVALLSPLFPKPHVASLLDESFLLLLQVFARFEKLCDFFSKLSLGTIEFIFSHRLWSEDEIGNKVKWDRLHTSWKEKGEEEPSEESHNCYDVYLEAYPYGHFNVFSSTERVNASYIQVSRQEWI